MEAAKAAGVAKKEAEDGTETLVAYFGALSRLLSQFCVFHVPGAAAAKFAKEEAEKKVADGK
jgi:hypothetical protein